MYSFFELSSTVAARAMAAAGALIITVMIMATTAVPASPDVAISTVGVLA